MILSPWSNQNLVEREVLAAFVYLLSILQLDRLLVEHVEEEHLEWVVFYPQIDSSGRRVPPWLH